VTKWPKMVMFSYMSVLQRITSYKNHANG